VPDSGSSADDFHLIVVIYLADFGPKTICVSSLTQHEESESRFARQLIPLGFGEKLT
jgi:hypothetical protein